MAGSHLFISENNPYQDALKTNLEVIQRLALHLRVPVTVIDRDFTVIYTNQPGISGSPQAQTDNGRAKCYASFFQRQEPCTFCPVIRVFEEGRSQSADCPAGPGHFPCQRLQAFPLTGPDGNPVYAVEIFDGLEPASDHARVSGEMGTMHSSGTFPVNGDPEALCGQSPVMVELFEVIDLVANSQVTALLQGESGTGKELVARTIHRRSPRGAHPFIVVDCGSLPETLLESELFGHVRGAFTGARSSKKGLFEEADGGTLFLDEIADTTPHFQSKLLRVIQEGEIKPVGSNRSIKVDVRIISATNKDLPHLVKTKAFREDLFYRLAVLPLSIPPLRDRREDIPLLVEHLMKSACQRHNKPLRAVPREVLHALQEANWPGNVRELKHTIERAIVTSAGPHLTVRDFFTPSSPANPLDSGLRSIARSAAGQAERARIREALRQSGGNRAQAARALKISRASLYNKLRAYEIDHR